MDLFVNMLRAKLRASAQVYRSAMPDLVLSSTVQQGSLQGMTDEESIAADLAAVDSAVSSASSSLGW